MWGIFKWKVRLFFTYSSQSWIFDIFEASVDTIDIFDMDVSDDLVQARWKFLTMMFFKKILFSFNIPHFVEFFKFSFFLTMMGFSGSILKSYIGYYRKEINSA